MKIAIVSSSVRTGRASHRAALFFKKFIEKDGRAQADLIDLKALDFPLFEERLKFQKDPLPAALAFSKQIAEADAVVIVSPEYNGSLPASLKNAIDLLNDEWRRKPIGLVPVSAGPFGGMQSVAAMLFPLWKLRALVSPVIFPVPEAPKTFGENGEPADLEGAEKRAKPFVEELFWLAKASKTSV